MAKKTGKTIVKMRQQIRAAKLARHKRELVEAGVNLSMPKPSVEARREKEEELKRLYVELFPKDAEVRGEEQAEKPPEQKTERKKEEQLAESEQQPQPEQQEQAEEQTKAEEKEQAENEKQAEEPQEKQGEQSD